MNAAAAEIRCSSASSLLADGRARWGQEGKIHERLRLVLSVVNGAAGAHSAPTALLRVPLSGQPGAEALPTDTETASLRETGLKGCPVLPVSLPPTARGAD